MARTNSRKISRRGIKKKSPLPAVLLIMYMAGLCMFFVYLYMDSQRLNYELESKRHEVSESQSRIHNLTVEVEKLTSRRFVLRKIDELFGQSYSSEDRKDVLLLKAEVLLATGKKETAMELLGEIVETNPLEGKALILMGQNAWEKEEFVQASLYFSRAAKTEQWKVKALIEHARMLVSTREYEEASRLLKEAQTINPQPRVGRYLESIQNLVISSRLQPQGT